MAPTTFGGLGGADHLCMDAAMRGNLSGTFQAWLSSSTTSAAARFSTVQGGWVGTDGNPIAASYADLVAGHMYYPIAADETGKAMPAAVLVATGTNADGTTTTGQTCGDWTNTGNGAEASVGTTNGTTMSWTYAKLATCTNPAYLYCLETDRTGPITPPSPPGMSARLAFVTVAGFDSSTGYSTASTLCNSEGMRLAPHGPFTPLLAIDGASASAPFTVGGRSWLRVDGVKVIDGQGDLSSFVEPLNMTAAGDYVSSSVVLGANNLTAAGVSQTDCMNWTSASMADSTRITPASISDVDNAYGSACSTSFKVFCLEN